VSRKFIRQHVRRIRHDTADTVGEFSRLQEVHAIDRGRVCAVVNQIAAYDAVTVSAQYIGDRPATTGRLQDRAGRQGKNAQKGLDGNGRGLI
jgi:hypothetical protein